MGVRGAGGDADGTLLGESETGQCRHANGNERTAWICPAFTDG